MVCPTSGRRWLLVGWLVFLMSEIWLKLLSVVTDVLMIWLCFYESKITVLLSDNNEIDFQTSVLAAATLMPPRRDRLTLAACRFEKMFEFVIVIKLSVFVFGFEFESYETFVPLSILRLRCSRRWRSLRYTWHDLANMKWGEIISIAHIWLTWQQRWWWEVPWGWWFVENIS